MDLPQLATQLAELGWTVLFVLVILVGVIGLYRKWLVPGWVMTDRDKRIAALEDEVKEWRRLYLGKLAGRDVEREPFSGGGSDVGMG